MPNLGLNLLFDSYPNEDAAARSVFPYLDRMPNDVIQVTTGARAEQGLGFARSLKSRYPKMDIVFRKMPDDSQHERFPDPYKWFESYSPWSDGGKFILSNTNEPGTGNIAFQNDWMTNTLELCGRHGIRCATWSLQTHNRFNPADVDSTIRSCARYQHPFSLHYYWGEGIPVDPIHLTVADYCQRNSIASFPFYITEVGYCGTYVDGGGQVQLDPYKGYQGRISSQDYADALVNLAMRYSELKWFIYGWGGQSPWQEFDISHDAVIHDELVEYNQKEPVMPPVPPNIPTEGGERSTLTAVPSIYVNVRSQPGFKSDGSTPVGVDMGDLLVGDICVVYPEVVGYAGWVYQTPVSQVPRTALRQPAASGWVWLSNGGVVFTPTGTPVPPEPEPPTENRISYTVEQVMEMSQMVKRFAEILAQGAPSDSGSNF